MPDCVYKVKDNVELFWKLVRIYKRGGFRKCLI